MVCVCVCVCVCVRERVGCVRGVVWGAVCVRLSPSPSDACIQVTTRQEKGALAQSDKQPCHKTDRPRSSLSVITGWVREVGAMRLRYTGAARFIYIHIYIY